MVESFGLTWLDVGNVIWLSTAAASVALLGVWTVRKTSAPAAQAMTIAAALVVVSAPLLGMLGSRQMGLLRLAPKVTTNKTPEFSGQLVPAAQVESPHQDPVQAAEPTGQNPMEVSASVSFSLLDALMLLWSFGCFVALSRQVVMCAAAWRLRRECIPTGSSILKMADRLCQKIGIPAPMIAESRRTTIPVALGPIHPIVILPEGMAMHVSPSELEAALCHELGHIAGKHHWTALLQMTAEVLFWWHPLVRLLGRVQEALQEEIADNFVLASGSERESYARFLLKLAQEQIPPESRVGLAIIASRSTLSDRVESLLRTERPIMTHLSSVARRSLSVSAAVVAVGLLLITIRVSQAASEETPQPQSSGTITVQSFKAGKEVPIGKAQILRPADKPPTIVYPASRSSTDTIEIKNGTHVAVAEGLEWQGKIAYLSLTFDLVVVDAKTKKCLWSRSVGAFWDTITFENVADAGQKPRWELTLRSSARPEYQRNYDLETGDTRELKGGPPDPEGKPLTPRKTWKGSAGVSDQKAYRLVRSAQEWDKLRAELFGEEPKDIPASIDVDWSKETLLVCYAGKSSNWNGIDVEQAVENNDRVLLRLRRWTYQTIGESVEEHPYGLIVLPKRETKPYVLEYNQQRLIGGPAIWREFMRLQLKD